MMADHVQYATLRTVKSHAAPSYPRSLDLCEHGSRRRNADLVQRASVTRMAS